MVLSNKSSIRFACAAAALIVACSPSAERADPDRETGASASITQTRDGTATVSPEPDQAELSIVVREDGLLVETPGHGQPLKFGETTPGQAEKALAALGPPRRSSNAECPAGPLDFMDWENGLQLAFQNGKLAGWWANDKSRGVATVRGLHPGSPRSAVDSVRIEDTSVGKLFTVAGVNGVLDDGTETSVAALWAGAACIFD
jgi:hypothetical protein